MSGTTTVHKSSYRYSTFTGVRNIDRGPDGNNLELPADSVEECVFPLTGSCDDKPDYDNLDPDLRSYVVHLCEGINQKSFDEFEAFVQDGQLGQKTSIIHGVSLDSAQMAQIASAGTTFIWSPQTNIDLYGQTANAPAVWNMGIPMALAPDWTISGTLNLLTEIKCADHLNTKYYDSFFTPKNLVSMVTSGAAKVMHVDDLIGYLHNGHFADVMAIHGDREHPFTAVVEMQSDDVRAVFVGGEAFYGDADALNPDIEFNDYCETIEVCGEQKRICIKEEAGQASQPLNTDDWTKWQYQDYIDYLQGELDTRRVQNNPAPEDEYLYTLLPLFDCSPYFACDLGNAYVPGEPTAGDSDGDGVSDGDDNCPNIFNPQQGDLDEDGTGDSCDECPYAEDPTNCPKPDPDDRDADGISNLDDNCPDNPNTDQADADGDGIGDVCDACPDFSNANGVPCPATVYDIKTGVFSPGDPVGITDVIVTGIAVDTGFFVQVPVDSADYDGVDYSGIFVFTGSSGPSTAVGDRVDISGTVANYYDEIQIDTVTDVTVNSNGNSAPAPEVVTPAEITGGGARADALEGVVCQVNDVNVTQLETTYNEWQVDNTLWLNDFLHLPDPFPVVGDHYTSIRGVLHWAYGDSKLEPRSADDLVTGPAGLSALTPAMSYTYEGTTAEPLPGLEVQLTGEAQSDRVVNLQSSDESVLTVPATITVPTGQSSVPLEVTGVSASANPVTITAELGGTQVTAQVKVLDGTETPQVVSVTPSSLSLGINNSGNLTATIDIPARTGGETLTVSASPGTHVTVPGTVNVPQGQFSVDFSVDAGATTGTETVEVSLGGSSESASIEVVSSAVTGLILSQVFYDHSDGDDGFEWIQIYNGSGSSVDLSGYSLGWGGTDYTYGTLQLSGTIPAFGCFVVGGPTADAENGNPTFDQAVNLDPDMQNSGSTADGVALFDVLAADITGSTAPIDAVIYGGSNGNGLLDETGSAGTVDVGDAGSGEALLRDGEDSWSVSGTPDPTNCPAF